MCAVRPSFNTTGPCIPGEHYMLPPERRLGRVLRLIDEGKYFTLHAGRQTGKTTSAFWLADDFNAGKQRRAVWIDIEIAREQPDPVKAFRTILGACDRAFESQLPRLKRPTRRKIE